MFTSIRARLTANFIGLAIIPLLLLGSILGYRSFQGQQRESLNAQSQLAQRTTVEVQAVFQNLEIQLQTLLQVRTLTSQDSAEQLSLMNETRLFESAFDQILLLNADGDIIQQSSRFSIETDNNYQQNDIFLLPAQEGITYYSPIKIDSGTNEPLVTISLAYFNKRSGDLEGVLVVDARLQELTSVINNLDLAEGQDVYLLDESERVIVHKDIAKVLNLTQFSPPSENGAGTGITGEEVLIATETLNLNNLRFTVVTEQSRAEALRSAFNNLLLVVGVILGSLLIAGLLGVLSVRQIIQPIINLADVASKIEAGDLTQRAEIQTNDELGNLAQSFNTMTIQLNQTVEGLEKTVDERTKKLQEALEEAQLATRLKDEFLATMSHELRTPLNAIMGYLGLIELKGDVGGDDLDMLVRANENAENLLTLINNILDISRMEAGRVALVPSEVNFKEYMDKTQKKLQVLADQKNVALAIIVEPSVPDVIYIDPDALTKVVVNLLGNALKFTESGNVAFNAHVEDTNLILRVEDTGIGIPAHKLDTIFERFRQVDGSSKRKYGGTGLGLSIVQSIVNAMEGKIMVDSKLQTGTTFVVSLPMLITELAQG